MCSYGYKLICADERYSEPQKTFFGKDAIDKFLSDMVKESKYCSKATQAQFNKLLVRSEKDHEDFDNFTKCWICKTAYEEGEVKVKYHHWEKTYIKVHI